VIPCKDDNTPRPRLAEPGIVGFNNDSALPSDADSAVRVRVNENRIEPRIEFRVAVQKKQARLGCDGDADFVAENKSAAPLECL
jgi:hypothetical protein